MITARRSSADSVWVGAAGVCVLPAAASGDARDGRGVAAGAVRAADGQGHHEFVERLTLLEVGRRVRDSLYRMTLPTARFTARQTLAVNVPCSGDMPVAGRFP
ncbi:hypothetical protein [Streptomyces sp. NPDC058335]|uniref:hypothetical protein n=1 Tax=Streptomyces sp. NPDC058335 TaxID=3346451 RepID=UPI003658F522